MLMGCWIFEQTTVAYVTWT